MDFIQLFNSKIFTFIGIFISYALIIYIWKINPKKGIFKKPLIFAYLITFFYMLKFIIVGVAYNVDPDLPVSFYPMVVSLLNGDNPLNVAHPSGAGILWTFVLAIPAYFFNSINAVAGFIAILYLMSVFMFYKLSEKVNKATCIVATQIYSLLPIIWFNVRDSQDDMLVTLIFISLTYLYYTKNANMSVIFGAISFYVKYFSLPFSLFISIGHKKIIDIIKLVIISSATFLIISVMLSYIFSVNIINYSLDILTIKLDILGLSYFVILNDFGLDHNIIRYMSLTIFVTIFTFTAIVVRIKKIGVIESSILFFICLYMSMYILTPWYFTWFVPFFILYYINKMEILVPSLIVLDLVMRIWGIAEFNFNHYEPLVYLSIFVVWIILINTYIDVTEIVKGRHNVSKKLFK